MQDKPESTSEIDPPGERLNKPFEVISDGIKIRGRIFFPVAKPTRLYPTLIICHGIPRDSGPRPSGDSGYEGLAEEFCSIGLVSLIFNFRGCGTSDGNFDITGWSRDLDTVLNWTLNTAHVDPTRVVVLGYSGGGVAAIRLAAETPRIYGLAVVGTPAHFRLFEKEPTEVVDDFRSRGIIRDLNYPPDLNKWYNGFLDIEPLEWIGHFKGKSLLIVHGDADELIPVEHAYELKQRAPAGISKLEIIQGGAHQLRLDSRCTKILKDWVLQAVR